MKFDRRSFLTLAVTLVIAGGVIAGGIYGPTAWKVFRGQSESNPSDQVIIQTPPVSYAEPQVDTQVEAQTDELTNSQTDVQDEQQNSSGTEQTVAQSQEDQAKDLGSVDSQGIKKYREPDLSQLNLAPSVEGYFGEDALSDSGKTLVFGAAWNIHQYADGYLFGVTSGPQMNEGDIMKYIIFHKTLWEKQMENEVNADKVASFNDYFRNMLNRGVDAFDSKDKVRIEQFHQEIHDFDAHLMRDDISSKVYGATPFATKRSE
ncbi:MAG: hypothetical protein WCR27_03570 [Eubacteriales bacterium]